ncbi:Nif3-like dinuclear metal center hexameric protein [Gallaecimonas kandeliae]|uniref:Nif3-like dinuclear metal center hexameric protein n=1 Tax=Gallaecimonas kandeliae TaxID=3029055 RepID=UPI002649DAE6|nr:Nif3-like dinuclear metal center hexameric protein [Gallaecimonas kandeliae]WKE66941.1 Nif3-like dinuclear metal center hexameric protein [Gallaecimonas kandeliae]
MERQHLLGYLDELLKPTLFRDYAPNGLQVEGGEEVTRIMTGVTASQALIDEAIGWGADLLLVHHGYFWKNEPQIITGIKAKRIKSLLAHDINLVGYHLPLDAHQGLGNNAQLARQLELEVRGALDDELGKGLVWKGRLPMPMQALDFCAYLEAKLGRRPLHLPGGPEVIETVAWCTGGAQDYIDLAADAGVDAFISGEVSERTTHIAAERGLHYFAAGHHATERYGIKALGEHLADQFDLDVRFVDLPNPV